MPIRPYEPLPPMWYTEQHEKFVTIRCDFEIGGFPAGCCETVSRLELEQAVDPKMIVRVRIWSMGNRRQRMMEASHVKP